MRIDAGKVEAEVLDNTKHLADQAQIDLMNQLTDLAGKRFFGESRVTLVWVAGQIIEVKAAVESRTR